MNRKLMPAATGVLAAVLLWGCDNGSSNDNKTPGKEPATPQEPAKPEEPAKPNEPAKPIGEEKAPETATFRCKMDQATRTTPGPCPKCGMELGEAERVPEQ